LHIRQSAATAICPASTEPGAGFARVGLPNRAGRAHCCCSGEKSIRANQSRKMRETFTQRRAPAVAVLLAAALWGEPALAHSIGSSAAGFAGGFLHPLSGLDHMLAMVSVGIWGAELGAPAIWLLPIAFPLIMAAGGALGVIGVPLPAGELFIALSVAVLGTLVALARRLPIAVALTIVGIFAIAHGHAHGVELPRAADALAFTVGFVLATGLLHLAGIAIGGLERWPAGLFAIRVCGGAVALTGCYLVLGYARA
jgi:urease accessory protein